MVPYLLHILQAAIATHITWEALRLAGAIRLPAWLKSAIVVAVAAGYLTCPWPLVLDAFTVAICVTVLRQIYSPEPEESMEIRRGSPARSRPGDLPNLA